MSLVNVIDTLRGLPIRRGWLVGLVSLDKLHAVLLVLICLLYYITDQVLIFMMTYAVLPQLLLTQNVTVTLGGLSDRTVVVVSPSS